MGVNGFNINAFAAIGRGAMLFHEMLNPEEINKFKSEFHKLQKYYIKDIRIVRNGPLDPSLNP
ncbi:MAG: hypothetical protein ACFFCW_06510 [Candidatus Hodarchaeota archaeon]